MSEDFDPDADVTVTLTAREAVDILEMLACAAGYREPHHCHPHDALAAFVEAWIEATGWDAASNYGPWLGFIEMADDIRYRREHQPDSRREDDEE